MSDTEPTEEPNIDADEYWQVHVYAPEAEYRVHAALTAESPEVEHAATRKGEKRELLLTEGGDVVNEGNPTPSPDHPFMTQVSDEHNLNRVLVHDPGVAVAYYLAHLETHAVGEKESYDQLRDNIEDRLWGEFRDFQASLTPKQRKFRLLDLLEFRVEDGGDWAAEPYRETGTWRSTNLSESAQKLATSIAQNIDLNPKHCYRNAQQAAILHEDNHRVEYVEGVALPKHGAQVSRHAWIEIDGEVCELTWPWHFFDGAEAVYFGAPHDKEEVAETFERRNGGSQIALSDEQIKRMNAVHRGEIDP